MKVLLINQHFHPEVASSGQIMTELCADLVTAGYEVTVLTGVPSYRTDEVQEKINVNAIQNLDERWKKKIGKPLFYLNNIVSKTVFEVDEAFGIAILRTYLYNPKKLKEGRRRYLQRMIQYLSFFSTSFITAMLLPKHDVVVYLSTPPLLNGIVAIFLKLLKGTKNIYNVQDLYPDVAFKLGAVKSKFIWWATTLLEKQLYRHASFIVPIGEKMARVFIEEKGLPPEKVAIISNWMDTNLITPIGKNSDFAREHKLEDKFVVMYSGNMGLSQGLEIILKCAGLTAGKEIYYYMIGGGASREALVKKASEMKLNNVKFLSYQPKERLSESLGAADVHLVPLKKGISDYSVPSKVYGIMASAKPIIASVDDNSEIAIILSNASCGIVVEPENPEALANAISALYNDRQRLLKLGENGRSYLEKTNTRQICVRKYMDLIERVVSPS